ncbi:Multi-sensor signal transduction histidine kinase [Thermus sp. CCB_US3_UF1]|nr:Multi-sensor signal transduction histidine kinase [Thermus sp. CCB_US3_UF1]
MSELWRLRKGGRVSSRMFFRLPRSIFSALERVHAALLEEPRVATATRRLLEVLVEELGVERAALFLYNPEERELQGEVAFGRGPHYTVSTLSFPLEGDGQVPQAFFAPPEGIRQGGDWFLPVVASPEAPCWVEPERLCRLAPRTSLQERSRVCPFCAHFKALGVLLLEKVPKEMEALAPLLARLTALAVRSAHLYEEVFRSRERLSQEVRVLDQVAQFSREIIRHKSPEPLVLALAQTLKAIFGFYRITVALVRGKELRGVLTLKEEEVFWTEDRTRIRFPLEAPDPLAQAARLMKPLLIPREELPSFLRGKHQSLGVVPLVGYVPIADREQVLGVVAVDHGPKGPSVTWHELRYVDALARVAGVALKNAYAHQELFELSEALARERERLARALEDLPVAVVVLEEERYTGFANRLAREALGLGREVLLDRLPPEVYPALEGKRFHVELGGRTYLASAQRDSGLWILSLTDISETQLLLKELETRETRFRTLLEHNQDVVYLLDEQGTIRYVTPNVRPVLGYDPLGYQREPVSGLEFVFPEDRSLAANLFRQVLAAPGQEVVGEVRVVNAQGEPRWFEVWARNLLHEPGVGGIVVTLHDLSARKEAERVKEEFIAAVSHELRTPLGVIIGLAEVLQLSPLPERERSHVDLILDSALRLKTMVDNLLDASRLEAGRFEVYRRPTNLASVLEEMARSFQAVAQMARVRFTVEISPSLPAEADPDRVAQVLGNLLSNAFKFTPRGGEVRLWAKAEAGWVEFAVSDTGPGIPEEEVPNLFQRYYRARSQASRGAPGSGLGLYISKAIVEAHGGEIRVDSRPGQGATFTVRIPQGGEGGAHFGGG